MAEKVAKVVLTYPPEVWERINPEQEAMTLGTRGFYCVTDLKEGIINAVPFSHIDPRKVFNDDVVRNLKLMGIGIEFKPEEVQRY
ncbi:MAG: hypothetical protein UX02_C0001G0078 [Candidatus Moranbacteria bacterium GW2011_GWC1_45_18]|nr:MAG: hypothetical protein UT79_C0002G0319 [Candidatus Moranbacteria bacterium GW2011_GWC2_40_12]KKT34158.1 MAG: hypothetical protein UW19_C0001G0053 [Candidatus Moranbacteria bacterium GW2011_GWF2_44_10]KKU00630.1 MAG: hypothetical protein UX02_C0001G0078 [Candidatus Moranbacteria bacterium GW2011_GWC1_45_18]OGI22607.1 MAG: hypothetical protein A2194_01710 [Candidatus Moranbacteria bacterium RIFOXYA1_FULL_44_8]OGI35810.1 MAG: hypothetical protein A2407_01480 [Candidatus Moranbacteria bacteri